eukprot:1453408-Prymnesium_polylepis.1
MDELVGGKAGEADGLAESLRSGAVGVRRGSVRAGRLTPSLLPRSNAWGLLGPSRWARLLPFLEYFGVALRA